VSNPHTYVMRIPRGKDSSRLQGVVFKSYTREGMEGLVGSSRAGED